MPRTRQSAERQLSKKRRILAILEEQIAGYTELEAPVSKLAERGQLREEVARLEALLSSGEFPETDEAELSVWEGVGARIEPEEVPLAHPSSPRVLLEKTGRTLMAVQLKVRRPAQPRKLMGIALGVFVVLVLLAAGFWIYTRLSAQLAPIPWPLPQR